MFSSRVLKSSEGTDILFSVTQFYSRQFKTPLRRLGDVNMGHPLGNKVPANTTRVRYKNRSSPVTGAGSLVLFLKTCVLRSSFEHVSCDLPL